MVQIQPSNPQEELVAPIALYPDPLIATILPAAVYPLEIVQAAFFLEDTNNLPNLDARPWDEDVKAVGHVPAVKLSRPFAPLSRQGGVGRSPQVVFGHRARV